jgi:catechol 2,3-dioxygenase-like lactoylglutathione lyase family enzyme
LKPAIPILRMFDVESTKRFYVDYLGWTVDWQDGEGDRPIYMQVSSGETVLHLSSHHGDGTPGSAVMLETSELAALHADLQAKGYPYLNPGLEPHPAGAEMTLLDPASNVLRFFERG